MRKMILAASLAVVLATFAGYPTASAASKPRAIPPNMIGLILTPTGFDGKIYESGQVDIGETGWFAEWGNKLVLLERAGFQIKEQFIQSDPGNKDDHEDHRCIVGPKREPMSLDVRLLFAMPDHTKPEGKQAILRMGVLGVPEPADQNRFGGDRVMTLDARSVYFQQVQQQVRGKIRDVCIGYADVEAVYKAVEKNGTPEGFSDKIRIAVGSVLAEHQSPLYLVTAVVSNVKPDPAVIHAIATTQAADKLVQAMTKIDDFVKEDKTGMRGYIFKMMTMQEMLSKADQSGRSTVFMTDVSGGANLTPVPMR